MSEILLIVLVTIVSLHEHDCNSP